MFLIHGIDLSMLMWYTYNVEGGRKETTNNMIDRFRKVEFELKFLNLIKKEVITDLELLQGTREQMPGLYKQYLELIQTGVLLYEPQGSAVQK